ncbi:hypothetical protein ACFVQ3_03515 [Oerskovia sp. NPDC057915]|uniref:hypothetical protein n=1 Tax=Oerskovia sp. NPDC057915 TaxID=3346280 RepID=UPI0036D79459
MSDLTGLGNPARPTSVTVAVVLTWIAAVTDMAGSVALFFLAGDAAVVDALAATRAEIQFFALLSLVVGVLVALVALGLQTRGRWALMAVTFVMLVRIGIGVYSLLRFGPHQLTGAVLTIVVALLVLALLWNGASRRYFRG